MEAAAIEELLKRHPNIDRMMAETLLKLHEQGKLEQFHARLRRARGLGGGKNQNLVGRAVDTHIAPMCTQRALTST